MAMLRMRSIIKRRYLRRINPDTPEICRLYIHQNGLVRDHFGALSEENFIPAQSVVYQDIRGSAGMYAFSVSGTQAKGALKMLLDQGSGRANGALILNAIGITEEQPLKNPLAQPKGPAHELSGFFPVAWWDKPEPPLTNSPGR